MRNKIFIVLVLIGVAALFSCHKSGGVNTRNLTLLQHQWAVVSENGGYPYATQHAGDNEFDPYMGWYNGTASDYWYFSTNDTLYRSIGNRNDTSAYTLSNDGRTLTLNYFFNGIKYSALSFHIDLLTNSRLILSKDYVYIGPVPLLDSLIR